MVVLDYYENLLDENCAMVLFKTNYPDEEKYEIKNIIKVIHYKINKQC